jgi:EmrB/QacA subfamily drug resistance transporter
MLRLAIYAAALAAVPRAGRRTDLASCDGGVVNQRVAVPVLYASAVFLNVMDVTIVNVALPSIGRQFDEKPSALNSVSVAYLLTLAVVIPAAGWFGNRYGMKRMFLGAVAVFTVASAGCGVAPSLPVLVIARAVQGVGAGAMIPVGMAMLMLTFPPEERVRVSSIMVIPTALGPALGPVVGGVLSTELSWRWVFYVNLPVGAAVLVFGSMYLLDHREPVSGSFDAAGFLLAGFGFGVLMFGVSNGASYGWGTVPVVASLATGAALIVVLVLVEARVPNPILALHLYRNRLFRSTSLAFVLGVSSLFGLLFMVPLLLQIGLGRSALHAGRDIFPEAIGVMVGSQLTTRWWYPTFGPRRLVIGALLAVGGTSLLLTSITAGTNSWVIRVLMFLLGLAMGPVYVASSAASFATVARVDMGQASSLFNSQRQFGTAVGIAILSTVLSLAGSTTGVGGHSANLSGYHFAFVAAALLALAGMVIAFGISDDDAAITIVRRRLEAEHSERVAVGNTEELSA